MVYCCNFLSNITLSKPLSLFHPTEGKDMNSRRIELYPKQLFKLTQKRQSKYSLNDKAVNVSYFLLGKNYKIYELHGLERCET